MPDFRFTHDKGSALLYYGDEFVAKFSSSHRKAFEAVLVANEIMRSEIDGFTKHVGGATFQESFDCLLRSNAQNMDVIEKQFNKIKELGKQLREKIA